MRPLRRVIGAPLQRHHYHALSNMARVQPSFARNLGRYLTGRGSYPYECAIRTPLGLVRPVLYSHHDLLTVTEIFCREDYVAGPETSVVVDVGSNLGISALYFLTRSENVRCYLYEPDLRNVDRLRRNLSGFDDRYELHDQAVADFDGWADFGADASGRYGAIGREAETIISVRCRHIDDVLRDVLDCHNRISILKIDTEGSEWATINAIDEPLLTRIDAVYLETDVDEPFRRDLFEQERRAGVRILRRQGRNNAIGADPDETPFPTVTRS